MAESHSEVNLLMRLQNYFGLVRCKMRGGMRCKNIVLAANRIETLTVRSHLIDQLMKGYGIYITFRVQVVEVYHFCKLSRTSVPNIMYTSPTIRWTPNRLSETAFSVSDVFEMVSNQLAEVREPCITHKQMRETERARLCDISFQHIPMQQKILENLPHTSHTVVSIAASLIQKRDELQRVSMKQDDHHGKKEAAD